MKKMFTACCLAAAAIVSAGDGYLEFAAGSAVVTALRDAQSDMPSSLFSGAPPAEIARLAPEGKSPAGVNTFLIKINGRTLLFDTGNGGSRGEMAAVMRRAAISAESVDAVVLTHMHGDHIGGLLNENGDAAFPNAELWVGRLEKEYWEKAAGRNADLARQVIDVYQDRLQVFEFDTAIFPGVIARDAVGHTPGHTMYELDRMLIVGDLVHAARLQFPNPNLCASYDMEAARAVVTRQRIFDYAAETGKQVAGMHLPFPGIGYVIKQDGGRYEYRPLEAPETSR